MLALPALAAGCGDDSESPSGILIDDAPSKLAETACGSFETCYGPLGLILFGEESCVQELTKQLESETVALWKAYVSAGTLVYHAENAQACLDAVATLQCEIFETRLPASCEEWLEGTVARGGDCNNTVECVGSDYCAFTGSTCPGKCAELLAQGEVCDEDDNCKGGLTCKEAPLGSPDKRCQAPVKAGESCGGVDDFPCANGLECAGDDPGSGKLGTCKPLLDLATLGVGDSCVIGGDELCQEGLSCVVDAAGPPPMSSCAAASPSGGPCKVGFPDPCPSDEFCDADVMGGKTEGICHKLATDGQSCTKDDQPFAPRCATGHVCDGTNTCRRKQTLGNPCGEDDICYSGTCVSNTCVAPPTCSAPEF